MTNENMKKHFDDALQKGVRRDGRKLKQFRSLTIERGVSSTAHGSARVTAGNAIVVAGVKIDVNKPYPDTPNDGGLMIANEMLPLSHRKFEPGPPKIDSIESARVVDRTIRESKTIDTKALCITPGEQALFVAVDLMPVAFDGNMIDLGAIAAMAALQDARIPLKKEDGTYDLEHVSDEKLPLSKIPVAITVFKYGDTLLVDPTEAEEENYDARLTIATLDDGKLCAMQKGGAGPLSVEDIEKMVEISVREGKKIREALKK